jgi:hypothetical protein
MEYEGVIIDGAVPRDDYERCVAVFDYLVVISEVGPHQELDPAWVQENARIVYPEMWVDLENEILDKINDILPDPYVCTVGEWNPGDVIVYDGSLV